MTNSLYDETIFYQSESALQHTATKYFRVSDFGLFRLSIAEKYPDVHYPTPNDIIPAGWFSLDIRNTTVGDVNGDSLPDLIIMPVIEPHLAPHNDYRAAPIILLQNKAGGFDDPKLIDDASNFPNQHKLYRLASADFNNDGLADFVAGGMRSFGKEVKTNYDTDNLPSVVWGSKTVNFSSTKNFEGLQEMDPPTGIFGYANGHSIAVGDFNGDGFKDFASDHFQFLMDNATDKSFKTKFLDIFPSIDRWEYPSVNAMAAADFNHDGFDDLIISNMPRVDNGKFNGGDLCLILGSKDGLRDGSEVRSIDRKNLTNDNIGTNNIAVIDVNGDGNQDVIILEHDWTSDSGDSTRYYSNGRLRVFVGDGKGSFEEGMKVINDPYAGTRDGEGNIHVTDVNGDGWMDVILTGYAGSKTAWNDWDNAAKTSIFLNQKGNLNLVDESQIPFLAQFQIKGYEQYQQWLDKPVATLSPIDIGNDGMVDFVGIVDTPLLSWPQTEPIHTIAYIVRATAPLGRDIPNERIEGTENSDRIFGYDGNDTIIATKGNDTIDGGTGIDRVVFLNNSASYNLENSIGKITITDKLTDCNCTDTLLNVERIQFLDKVLALDIDGNAGQAYRLYQAALDRTPDQRGLADWINYMDNGGKLNAMSQMFIDSQEFRAKYGTLDNFNFVNQLYLNVLDRAGEPKGVSDWVGALNAGAWTRAEVLAGFSESAENKANVFDQIKTGIPYVEYWLT